MSGQIDIGSKVRVFAAEFDEIYEHPGDKDRPIIDHEFEGKVIGTMGDNRFEIEVPKDAMNHPLMVPEPNGEGFRIFPAHISQCVLIEKLKTTPEAIPCGNGTDSHRKSPT